ncbi:hypothetical protein DPMN_118715 [Dreissena polymorpha]|uniref:Uncharacterized protein n=1 Tax=Dreissena polymorpha TaxID=45954 RepID=A0A9D4GL83_DREPO|nr:hypothetical protein DPMN_118715 [Dreissena polymorpha]
MAKVSDYHSGGRGFNPRPELSIFTLMATRQKRNVNAGMGLSCLMVSGRAMRMQDML